MTHRKSSVKVYPEHLKTQTKKFFMRIPLNCRKSEILEEEFDSLNELTNLEKIIQKHEYVTIQAELTDRSSSNKRMKPQKILI